MIEHAGIVNRLRWMQAEYQLHGRDWSFRRRPTRSTSPSGSSSGRCCLDPGCAVAPRRRHRDPERAGPTASRPKAGHHAPLRALHARTVRPSADAAALCTRSAKSICSGEGIALRPDRKFFQRLPQLPTRITSTGRPKRPSMSPAGPASERTRGRSSPSAGRSATSPATSSTGDSSRHPIGTPGELYLAAWDWPGATSSGPTCRPSSSSPTLSPGTSGCTRRATWPAGCPTERSSTWADSTGKSRSAATASNWATSKRRCGQHRRRRRSGLRRRRARREPPRSAAYLGRRRGTELPPIESLANSSLQPSCPPTWSPPASPSSMSCR